MRILFMFSSSPPSLNISEARGSLRNGPVQLIINTFGASLRKQGEQFIVTAGEKKLALSAHKVQSILVTTSVHLTTDAIELALAHNIDLVLLDRQGEPLGRFWQTRMG